MRAPVCVVSCSRPQKALACPPYPRHPHQAAPVPSRAAGGEAARRHLFFMQVAERRAEGPHHFRGISLREAAAGDDFVEELTPADAHRRVTGLRPTLFGSGLCAAGWAAGGKPRPYMYYIDIDPSGCVRWGSRPFVSCQYCSAYLVNTCSNKKVLSNLGVDSITHAIQPKLELTRRSPPLGECNVGFAAPARPACDSSLFCRRASLTQEKGPSNVTHLPESVHGCRLSDSATVDLGCVLCTSSVIS